MVDTFEFIANEKILWEVSKANFAAAKEQHNLNRIKHESLKVIFEKNKAEFEKQRAQCKINDDRFQKTKEALQAESKRAGAIALNVERLRREYEYTKTAEFLLQFESADMKIDGIPLLRSMQAVAAMQLDNMFPVDCIDNCIIGGAEWAISNKDVTDSRTYLNRVYVRRISIC